MDNKLEDFLILHDLGINGKLAPSPSIIPVSWNPPPLGWLKVNIDGAAKGALGHAGCGGIFCTCRGFVKGIFSFYLDIKFAFEAELTGLILAKEVVAKYNWNNLWVESDSEFIVNAFKCRSQGTHLKMCLGLSEIDG